MQRRNSRILVDLSLHRVAQIIDREIHIHKAASRCGRGHGLYTWVVTAVVGRSGPSTVVGIVRISAISVRTDVHVIWRVIRRGLSQARLPVSDQHRHGDSPRRREAYHFQRLVLALPFTFVSAVLKPNFHLGGGELQYVC